MNIKKWKPPAGFRAGDTVDLKTWKGGPRSPTLMRFVDMNLAQLVKWRTLNREFVSARQKARYDVAMNKAMTAADPLFINHYDNEHGIKDPENGKWLLEPGFWSKG
jgi:hypothetical protein